MSKAAKRTTTLLVLAALWFSALSPAVACVLFADRPDILARVAKLPVPGQESALGSICHTEATGANAANAVTDKVPEPIAHGIYCSFCLATTAFFGLPALAGAMVPFALAVYEPLPSISVQRPLSSSPLTHRSRAPPAIPLKC